MIFKQNSLNIPRSKINSKFLGFVKLTTHDEFLEPSSSGMLADQIFERQIILSSLGTRTPKDLSEIAS
jgi:hypothetical protein